MSLKKLRICDEVAIMTYEQLSAFAQTSGMIYFITIFVAVCLYAFWPKNKAKFDKAAQVPLENEDIAND
jgi:cytochrome c oxidase cbb3-type subunit IV